MGRDAGGGRFALRLMARGYDSVYSPLKHHHSHSHSHALDVMTYVCLCFVVLIVSESSEMSLVLLQTHRGVPMVRLSIHVCRETLLGVVSMTYLYRR